VLSLLISGKLLQRCEVFSINFIIGRGYKDWKSIYELGKEVGFEDYLL
jgi:hypothetical protein